MINKILKKILFSFGLIICNFLLLSCSNDNTSIIMVAASLNEVIQEEYEKSDNNDKFYISYGGSMSLARRIENNEKKIGAVILASNSSIEILINKALLKNSEISLFAKNSLVLATSNSSYTYETFVKDNKLENEKKIIIADPEIAPAGSYSKQVLENIFHESDIDNKIISSGDVSYVSSMLVSNDKYYGILYKTEAIKNDLFIIHEFPNTFHDDIEYKTGVLSQNNNTYINNFIDRLNSPTVKKKLSELGFEVQK